MEKPDSFDEKNSAKLAKSRLDSRTSTGSLGDSFPHHVESGVENLAFNGPKVGKNAGFAHFQPSFQHQNCRWKVIGRCTSCIKPVKNIELRKPCPAGPPWGGPAGQGEGRGRIFHITGPKRPKGSRACGVERAMGRRGPPAVKKPQKVEALRGKQVVKKSKMWYHKLQAALCAENAHIHGARGLAKRPEPKKLPTKKQPGGPALHAAKPPRKR